MAGAREPPARRLATALARAAWVAGALAAVAVIGTLHYHSGLAYEFHVFFLLPAAVGTWFAGARPGALIALTAVLVWGITDWHLGGAQSDLVPLLFNSAMRFGVFLVVVGLLARLKAVLAREIELARHDPLTGLPNRRMFYAEGALALAQARRRREPLTALFLDLDHFKRLNDELGHQAGDALLRAVAGVLRRQVRGSDVVGRLGGDEFALLLPGMGGEAALVFAAKLKARLDACAAGQWRAVGFSIGLACFRDPPADIETVLAQADALMYKAKRAGRDTICRQEFDGAAPAPAATDEQ